MAEKNGYMDSVLGTLKPKERRDFPLEGVNVPSWRSVVSRANRRVGYKRYTVTANEKLGIMVLMCHAEA